MAVWMKSLIFCITAHGFLCFFSSIQWKNAHSFIHFVPITQCKQKITLMMMIILCKSLIKMELLFFALDLYALRRNYAPNCILQHLSKLQFFVSKITSSKISKTYLTWMWSILFREWYSFKSFENVFWFLFFSTWTGI